MTETDEVKLNDINEEGLIDHRSRNRSLNNQIVVYSLFRLSILSHSPVFPPLSTSHSLSADCVVAPHPSAESPC